MLTEAAAAVMQWHVRVLRLTEHRDYCLIGGNNVSSFPPVLEHGTPGAA